MADILDSGERREFSTGAVRDIQEGKGRCDLLPLGIVAEWIFQENNITHRIIRDRSELCISETPFVLYQVNNALLEGDFPYVRNFIMSALHLFLEERGWSVYDAILEVSKHFEDGARKYGDNNWKKGIPLHCYIDSGVRHYLKWRRGDNDERHDRAFVWNMLCFLWTFEQVVDKNLPEELNDICVNRKG